MAERSLTSYEIYRTNISPFFAFFFVLVPIFSALAYCFSTLPNFYGILVVITISSIGFWILFLLFPLFCEILQSNAGKSGFDLCKPPNSKFNPVEPMGIFISIIYLILAVYMQVFLLNDDKKMVEYNAGLFTICFISLLGYADDCLKLAWRYKIITPLIGCVPLIFTYRGSTTIILPQFLVDYFGITSFNLSYFYHLLMLLSIVFYCNAINIYSGVNGLEVGQSIILSFFIILYNTIEILNSNETAAKFPSIDQNTVLFQNTLSLFLSIPFFSISLSTLLYNWTPTNFFVGDAYTYFAGAHFAVTVILGHSIRTFILFSIPQIINFLISIPQLLSIFGTRCPNHRLPHLDRNLEPYIEASKIYNRLFVVDKKKAELLINHINNTKFEDKEHEIEFTKHRQNLMYIQTRTQIYPIYYTNPSDRNDFSENSKMLSPKQIKDAKINYTINCLILKLFGPMKEQNLVKLLLLLQFLFSLLGLALRYSPFYTIFMAYKI